jgi:hypothetical protein
MNEDITSILRNWDYDPENSIRIIKAVDGRDVLQVRQPLGIEQYEMAGRPDGHRPHGVDSYLTWYMDQLQKHRKESGSEQGFHLSHDDFLKLQNEGLIFYSRYFILFQMGDYERTARDTGHNLKICDLIDQYVDNAKDKKKMLQYKPYILRVNAISKAMISLNKQLKSAAADILKSAIELIQNMPNIETPEFQFEKLRSLLSLRATLKDILGKELSPVEELKAKLQEAVDEEEYEIAAELRDKIINLEIENALQSDVKQNQS